MTTRRVRLETFTSKPKAVTFPIGTEKASRTKASKQASEASKTSKASKASEDNTSMVSKAEASETPLEFGFKNVFSRTSTNQFAMEFKSEDYVYFGSGMDNIRRTMSNFSNCMITGEVYVRNLRLGCLSKKRFAFPSAEHFWCAHFMEREEDVERLSIGGDLSTVESGLSLIYGGMDRAKLRKKIEHWSGRECVGTVAKLLSFKCKDTHDSPQGRK